MGNVQSGKTGTYTGLICKAVDAGYKVIVVLAGMFNDLREQTQVDIEEGFIGYKSVDRIRKNIGVGLYEPNQDKFKLHVPTTRSHDFNVTSSRNFGTCPGEIPIIFVIKKNNF